jgi:hypothetical protein
MHLGSYEKDETGIIAMMQAEQEFFLAQNRKMGVWLDLYETHLSIPVIDALLQMVDHLQSRISKLSLVGVSRLDRWKIQRRLKAAGMSWNFPLRYYRDPEEAKTWLVNERES